MTDPRAFVGRPAKPAASSPQKLPEKPVPKPRRRLTIGAGDGTENGTKVAEEKPKDPKMAAVEEEKVEKSVPLARKAMAYRNGTAPMAPQLPRKPLKNVAWPREEPAMARSEIGRERKEPREGQLRMRRSATTLTGSGQPAGTKLATRQNGTGRNKPAEGGARLRIPAPPVDRIRQGQAKAGAGGGGQNKQWGGKAAGKEAAVPFAKEFSPIPYLTPFCPTASPEPSSATTGSSLNSPSPPPPPPPAFARSWPSEGKEGEEEDKLLEELARQGGQQCRLIASWLGTAGRGGGGEAGEEMAEEEEERPRFSLDRLVPPELQEPLEGSADGNVHPASIWADFTLRRPSPRGQCQGTVFVHWHQAREGRDFPMPNGQMEEGQKMAKIQLYGQHRTVPAPPPKAANKVKDIGPFSSQLEMNTSNSLSPNNARSRQCVTQLEQLVKSHPIWFLPHLDRQAVAHLLRNQPPGVFIVRGSSRAISQQHSPSLHRQLPSKLCGLHRSGPFNGHPMMALSIRLPPSDADSDGEQPDQLDHFLLEAIGPGQSVRLEGSPNTFGSLPLLLEHYSQPEAVQELKCPLRLPEAVARCESIQALQGLALMGQDFWTSSLCTSSSCCSAGSSPGSSSASGVPPSSQSQCQSLTSSSLRSGPLPPFPVLPALPPPPAPPPPAQPQAMSSFHFNPPSSPMCQSPCPSTSTTTGPMGDHFRGGGGHASPMYGHQVPRSAAACCCCAGCPAHQQAVQQQQQNYQYQQFPPLRKSHSVQSSLPPGHAQYPQQVPSSNALPWCTSPGSQSLREGRKVREREGSGFLRALFSPSPSRRKMPEWRNGPGKAQSPLWEEPAEGEIWNNQRPRAKSQKSSQQPQQQNGSIFSRLKGNFRRQSTSGLAAKDDWNAGSSNISSMSPELLWARQAAFRRTNTDMGGCGMAAALGRMHGGGQQQQRQAILPPANLPMLPQLARVAPQPRGEQPSTTTMGNGRGCGNSSSSTSHFLTQIAAPPADIRKIGGQKSCWARPVGQQQQQFLPGPQGLRRIQQQPIMRVQRLDEPGSQSGAGPRLSNGSARSQAVIATVRPQPKMPKSLSEELQKPGGEGDYGHHHQSQSEYTHLNELKLPQEREHGNGNGGGGGGGRCSFGSKHGDELSVAGTDFNEPWDSNAWENLLDLARFGDAKAEIPSLNAQPRRRTCSSSSSNGSTWRRSSHSSSTEEEAEDLESQKEEQNGKHSKNGPISGDEMSVAAEEEAMAMAMVLAGNGTLSNRRKLNRTREGEENDPPKEWDNGKQFEQNNPSLDTLIIIEQAAKAASSSRGNFVSSQNGGRWTRGTSCSMTDISRPIMANGSVPDRPAIEENGTMAGSSREFDPFSGSMNELNQHKQHINFKDLTTEANDDGLLHRRSERRLRAMMEKSIDERRQQMSPIKSGIDQQHQQHMHREMAPERHQQMTNGEGKAMGSSRAIANNNVNTFQFNNTSTTPTTSHPHQQPHPHHHHHVVNHVQHQAFPVAACSSSLDELSHHSRSGSICPSITPVLSPSRLRNASLDQEDPSRIIQRYVENLSTDDQTVFGGTLQRFIECTLLSREQDPYVVVRRVRQFLNGMKNYLVKNGEADLHAVIERESGRLNANEFLNIDAILESVLNKILLARIKAQLYRLMILESTRNGELGKLSENLALIRSMSPLEFGFPDGTPMPDKVRMEAISKQLRKMQNHYSPLKKLQLLLRALALAVPHLPLLSNSELRHQQAQQSDSSVLDSSHQQQHQHPSFFNGHPLRIMSATDSSSNGGTATAAALKHPPADELIRWLVYVLARSSTINCEIEAWYMWELLPGQVLSTGDAAYFLSILFSAVHVLKHPDSVRRLRNISLPASHPLLPLPDLADFLGSQSTLHDPQEESDLLLRVAVPNEQEGSIEYHTFPVLPKMNAAKLCRVIAHQFSVSNPEDYGLYVLFEGLETVLNPTEFPHLIRDQMVQSGKAHLFAYKRSEARIAWPRQAVSNFVNAVHVANNNGHPVAVGKEGK